jgi:excisionase family DNA binding protein
MPIKLGEIKLYSVQELAKSLDVTTVTLRAYIKQGKLKARKMGGKWYVSEESLKSYFNPQPEERRASV